MTDNAAETTVTAQVASIMKMNNRELSTLWQELLGKKAPALHTKILRQRLAWKVQELALGGLSEIAQKRLQQVKLAISKGRKIPQKRNCELPPGTRLVKEYHGEEHSVLVTPEGLEYRGQIYRSLTQIACLITGSKWNGPAFFGLRKEQEARKTERRKQKMRKAACQQPL